MKKRKFGATGLEVSILGFGAGGIGDSSISEKECEYILNSIVDAGINLIDSARSYGVSEERIGKYLSHRRKDVFFSTKIGYGIPGYQDWTPSIIRPAIEHALRMFRTDCIDIVHLHSCPLPILQQQEMLSALQRAVQDGKIKVAAYSGDNEPLVWALQSEQFGGLQPSINICDQAAIPLLELASQKGVGIIAKRALANAPWRNAPPTPGDQAAAEYRKRWERMSLPFPAEQAAEIALRFAAFLPGVHTCLVGSTKLHHIQENIRHLENGPLSEDMRSKIRGAFQTYGKSWPGQI